MYVRMVWGKLRRGTWNEYERHYNERVLTSTKRVKGLRQRQLLRSTEDPDQGMSLSTWDTLEDMLNYEKSEVRQTLAQEVDKLHAGDYWVKHFEVSVTNP